MKYFWSMFFVITNIVCGYICAADEAYSLLQKSVNNLDQQKIEQIQQQKKAEGIAYDIQHLIAKIPPMYHPIIAQSCEKYLDDHDNVDNDLQAQIDQLTNLRAFVADFYYDYQRKQLERLHKKETDYLSLSTLFLDSTVVAEGKKKKLLYDQQFPKQRNVDSKNVLAVQACVEEKKQDVQVAYNKALGTGCIVSGGVLAATSLIVRSIALNESITR